MAYGIFSAPATLRSRSEHSSDLRPSSPGTKMSLPVRELTELATTERLPYEAPFLCGSYLQLVGATTAGSPTLHELCAIDSKHGIDVVVLDIKEDGTCHERMFNAFQDLKDTLQRGRPLGTVVRLVLAEGLSLATVVALGSTLDLKPQFFTKHLDFEPDYTGPMRGEFPANGAGARARYKSFEEEPQQYISMRWKSAYARNWPSNLGTSGMGLYDKSEDAPTKVSSLNKRNNFRCFSEHFEEHVQVIAVDERLTFVQKGDDLGLTGVFFFSRPPKMSSRENEGEGVLNRRTIYTKHLGPAIQPDTSTTRTQFLNYLLGLDPKTRAAMIMEKNSNLSTALSHLILPHWRNVFSEMDNFLNSVDEQLSGGEALQTDMVEWGAILGDYRRNLFQYNDMIGEVLEEIRKRKLQRPEICFGDLPKHVTSLMERTEKSFSALMSSMAIMESQRKIHQAEVITRLKQLACYFIPLGFTTSLLAVVIQGWGENYKPYIFGMIVASLLCGAYDFRILALNQIPRKGRQRLDKTIRNDSNSFPPWFEWLLASLLAGLWESLLKPLLNPLWVALWDSLLQQFLKPLWESLLKSLWESLLESLLKSLSESLLEASLKSLWEPLLKMWESTFEPFVWWEWTTCLLSCATGMSLGLVWAQNTAMGIKIGISESMMVVMLMWLALAARKFGGLHAGDARNNLMLYPILILGSIASPLHVIHDLAEWIKRWFRGY